MIKKILAVAIGLAISSVAFGQARSIVEGEVTPGVYENIKSTNQALNVTFSSGASPVTGVAETFTQVSVAVTSTSVATANATRKYIQIQNQDAANPIWIKCDGTAATADGNGVKILAGQTWAPNVPPVGACNGISTGGTVVTNVTQG